MRLSFFNFDIISDCSDSRCHSYTECRKELNICFCKPVLEIYSPVCGSDDKTYDSMYHLNHTSCMEERYIAKLYSGSCQGLLWLKIILKFKIRTEDN